MRFFSSIFILCLSSILLNAQESGHERAHLPNQQRCEPCEEFRNDLHWFMRYWQKNPTAMAKFPEITMEMYASVLTAKIVPKDHIYLTKTNQNGKIETFEAYAANYPAEWKIEINISKWPELRADGALRDLVEKHEVFGLLGLERDSYSVSSKSFRSYTDHYEMLPMPGQLLLQQNGEFAGTSFSNGEFRRDEHHFPKSKFTKVQAEEKRAVLAKQSFAAVLLDSQQEWIVIGLQRCVSPETRNQGARSCK